MTSSALKITAIVTMLIDHTGMILFPRYMFLRYIGRLAFPIFCFLISEGFTHTSDKRKYMLRLVLFAVVSEIPYNLAVSGSLLFAGKQNVFFTLSLGLSAVWIIEKAGRRYIISVIASLLLCLAARYGCTDYGFCGVWFIISFYVFRNNRLYAMLAFAAETFIYCRFNILAIQMFACLAIIPLSFYNGEKGKNLNKYFYYAFYPTHLLVLVLIKRIVLL